MPLTEEQRNRIEENKKAAALKRQKNQRSEMTKVSKIDSYTFYSEKITGTCILISPERFKVEIQYSPILIGIFKSIASSSYEYKSRHWSFNVTEHSVLLSKIRTLAPRVTLISLPPWILKTFGKPPRIKENTTLDHLDSEFISHLMPFQKEGILFGLKHQGRVLIADDMGLGKTIQALGIAVSYKSEWPLLIVAPSSVRFSWKDSILRWLPHITELDINVITSKKDSLSSASITILSYDLLRSRLNEALKSSFKVVILDESHFLKNYKSSRCQASEKLLKNSSRIIMCSGTPALSKPIELYTQISILLPDLFSYSSEFGLRYCDGKKISFGNKSSYHNFSGSSNMEELKLLLEATVMIRRLKSDVLNQLPPKLRQTIILDPHLIELSSKGSTQNTRRELLQWFHQTAFAKEKAIQDYVSDLLEGNKKFLLFVHHSFLFESLEKFLNKKSVNYISIDGKTSSESRSIAVKSFQNKDSVRVALLSITSANAGITLTAAQLVVFAELFWNPGILTQAEDRAHRIGQTDSVIVQYLVAQGTADDELWPMIQRKLNVLNQAGLSKDNFFDSDSTFQESKSNKITNYMSVPVEEDFWDFDFPEI